AGLIADLDATSRQQRHPATQVCRFCSLREVEFGARRAKLIVEVMNRRIRLLAYVTMLRLGGFTEIGILHIALFEVGWRKNVWRSEESLAAELSNAGLRKRHFLSFRFPGFVMPAHGLDQSSACCVVGLEDLPCSAQQSALIFFGNIGEKLSIFGNRLQQFSSQSQAFFKMVRHRARRTMSILPDFSR